jgi:hypothetical protein
MAIDANESNVIKASKTRLDVMDQVPIDHNMIDDVSEDDNTCSDIQLLEPVQVKPVQVKPVQVKPEIRNHDGILEELLQTIQKLGIDSKHSNHCKQVTNDRLKRGAEATAKLLTEYKNASGVRNNQIEFLQFRRNDDGLYDCEVTENNIALFEKIEEYILSDSSFNLNTAEIDTFLDMVSRVVISRVIDSEFNRIENFRNNIINVYRRGIYTRMKNVKGYLLLGDILSIDMYNKHIRYAIIDLYLVFDVFCALSSPYISTSEFRYFLQKNSDYRNTELINSIHDLYRMTDVIYYHSLDSNMKVDHGDGPQSLRKHCRCRYTSFMPVNSLSRLIEAKKLERNDVFITLSGILTKNIEVDINQIELIERALDSGSLDEKYRDVLISLVNNRNKNQNNIDKNKQTRLDNSFVKVKKKQKNYKYPNRRNEPKNIRKFDRNYPNHNFNAREQKTQSKKANTSNGYNRCNSAKTKTAETDMHWRKRK